MEEQYFEMTDLILYVAFLGSLSFFAGLLFQAFVALKNQGFISANAFFMLIITRLATFAATFFMIKHLPESINWIFGPIFIPTFISEIILSPILLFLAGFKISFKKKIKASSLNV